MTLLKSKYDVVIIGSGISALTCAALLTKKGKSVCVLEQYNKAGGYMHNFSRFGTQFDTGAHYVGGMGVGQPFRAVLEYLGVYNDEHFIELDKDGFDVLKFPTFDLEIPVGYPKLIERLIARFPNEGNAIRTYFATIHEVANNFPTYRLNDDVDNVKLMKSLDLPLATFVEGLTQNPKLRFIFYTYCVLHGVEPQDVSLGTHSIVTDSLIQGAYGFKNGGDALTNSFVAKIKSNGSDVFLKKNVTKIETAGGLAKAVHTATGERIEADWVIAAIHPKIVMSLVDNPEIFSPMFRDRIANLKETIGLFGVYTKRKVAPNTSNAINPLKNYYYFRTEDPVELMTPQPAGEEPQVIFLSPAGRKADPKTGAVHVNIHAVGPIEWFTDWEKTRFGKRPEDYENFKAKYAEQVFNLVNRFEPGFSSTVEDYVTSSPITNLHFNQSPEGSPYGLYHSIQNTGARAIGPRTKIPNLLLSGQNCLFPGLLAGAIAGLRTSGNIIGIKHILHEIREGREGK